MQEAVNTPSDLSQISEISSITVPNSITADLVAEKPTAPPGFHWLGDKPVLIYDVRDAIYGASRPVPCINTTNMRASEANKVVFGSLSSRLSEVLGQCLICLKVLSVDKGGKCFLSKTLFYSLIRNTYFSDMGNVFKHIKMEHPLYVPPSMWLQNKSEEHSKYWSRILSLGENESNASSKNSQPPKIQSTLSFANRGKLSVPDQLNLITESVTLGFLPVSFATNRGLHHLVAGYNGGIYPYGLGDKAVSTNIKSSYLKILEDRKKEISRLLPPEMSQFVLEDEEDDIYKYCRLFAIQHDCWSSRAAKAFLGLILMYINDWSDIEKWILESVPLACQPFDVSHTFENILNESAEILKLYDIPLEYVAGTTQDTALNSFNAFNSVPVILQLPCSAHKFGLCLYHGFENVVEANVMIEAVQSVMKRLKGCNSSKRKTVLERVCKEPNVKNRRPILKCATRWNSAEMMVTRFLSLLPALRLIKEEDMPTSSDEQVSWTQVLQIACSYSSILEVVLPVLTCKSMDTSSFNERTSDSIIGSFSCE